MPTLAGAEVVKNIAGYKLGPGKYSYNLGTVDGATSYKMVVTNGAAKNNKERVSSAVISLGGSEVFGQKDFNQNVTQLSADFTPEQFGAGKLDVKINGRPGGYLMIKVTAVVPAPAPAPSAFYRDYDFDTYGDPRFRIMLQPGQAPPPAPPGQYKWVDRGGDCNDRNPAIYPGKGCPPLR
jgi:hypothetical protein